LPPDYFWTYFCSFYFFPLLQYKLEFHKICIQAKYLNLFFLVLWRILLEERDEYSGKLEYKSEHYLFGGEKNSPWKTLSNLLEKILRH
jgi:hypothetical protein